MRRRKTPEEKEEWRKAAYALYYAFHPHIPKPKAQKPAEVVPFYPKCTKCGKRHEPLWLDVDNWTGRGFMWDN